VIAPDFGQDAVYIAQGTFPYDDVLSYLQKWPGLSQESRFNNSLKNVDLVFINRVGIPAYPDNFSYALSR